MNSTTTRRRYLKILSVSTAVGLAGCSSGGSSDGPETGDEDPEAAGEDGMGSDLDEDDPDGSDSGGSDSDGNDYGGSEDPTDEESLSGGDDDAADGTEDESAGDDDDDGGDPTSTRLRDVFRWEDSYVMDFDSPTGSGHWTLHEGDAHMRWTDDGEVVETYHIGNEYYMIVEGQCYKRSVDHAAFNVFDIEEPAEDVEEYYATGTDTIDGEAVYVFDVGDGAYYISQSTGYPLRFEGYQDGSVVTIHSWGSTDPIQPPDMDCFSR